MHSYLRSIGFKNINKEKLEELLYEIEKHPDSHEAALDSEDNEYVEMRFEVAPNIGIAIRGIYDEDDVFQMDYYYPYNVSEYISTRASVDLIKQSDKECYEGLCDELSLGVNLIFYLQNMVEYFQKKDKNTYEYIHATKMGGLSLDGKILLPIKKEESQVKNTQQSSGERNRLMAAARDGDEEAIENLTIEDMDTYAMIAKRIQDEDVLSIVKTYFMPYGIESDKYTILGEIKLVQEVVNQISKEEMYVLTLNCNDITLKVSINKEDLLGEPVAGRRFKGDVWIQGTILFRE